MKRITAVKPITVLLAEDHTILREGLRTLLEAEGDIEKGNTYFSPSIARRLHNHYEDSPKRRRLRKKKGDRLTSRQVEVLQLIAEGRTNRRVAAELGLSVKTVEKHRQRLMAKLNIHDTAGLTRYAIETGIIESSVQLTIV